MSLFGILKSKSHLNSLLDPCGGSGVVRGVDVVEEHRVDERRLAEPGFTGHHEGELEALLHGLAVHLVGEVGEADVAVELADFLWLNRDLGRLRGGGQALGLRGAAAGSAESGAEEIGAFRFMCV